MFPLFAFGFEWEETGKEQISGFDLTGDRKDSKECLHPVLNCKYLLYASGARIVSMNFFNEGMSKIYVNYLSIKPVSAYNVMLTRTKTQEKMVSQIRFIPLDEALNSSITRPRL